ncbi:hypothetical protein [Maritimibacter sp. DP1N21-5]|uniref:hypothetical protein n=1 Tax=Maritimibacter sp. DP1N21-5 TaxID=2836867 RepID=UPI001C443873|nr:hypothetical protein [Maritimibacter sp. DP1N21-5]MBV7408007.1 hypothetical protein [Maritimibacter sp. DP1N21-5]
MKVTTDTEDLLILEDRPLFLAIMLSGFILVFTAIGLLLLAEGVWAGLLFAGFGIVIGGAAHYLFVRRVQVVFHRPEGWFELRQKTVLANENIRHALADLSHAALEVSQASNGTATYRVSLYLPRGDSAGWHPVTQAYSNAGGQQRCVDRINVWLGVTDDRVDPATLTTVPA